MQGKVEVVRQLHEDVDRHMEEVVKELAHEPKNHRHRMHHEHFVSERLDEMQAKRRRLASYYKEAEKETLAPQPISSVVDQFFDEFASLEQYHNKFPHLKVAQPVMATPDPSEFKVEFSGEECFGKYVDMHNLFSQYMELPFNYDASGTQGKSGVEALVSLKVNALEYVQWVEHCTKFHRLPRKDKNLPYKAYLENMLAYLKAFYTRTHPLSLSADAIVDEGKQNFEDRWAAGGVLGWEDVEQVAVPTDRKLTKKERKFVLQRSVALLEELVQRFYDMLKEVVDATLAMLDRKETKSKEELDAEVEREEQEAQAIYSQNYGDTKKVEDDEDEDAVKIDSNPKNLPTGFDGQHIPVWLYKLHGLNMKFTCEICRGYTYVGPLPFDKHFQEARHAHGMKCLGIPNTRHFHHVTGVQEALALWAKLKQTASTKDWNKDSEWECEDSEGRVMSKKTHDDMRRHGMLS